jgi:putative ABC transport system permease protein
MNVPMLVRRLVALFSTRRLERELEGEILAHLEMAERDAIAAGLSPAEARLAARRQFGNVESMKEAHRDRRGVRWIDTLRRDIRYGLVLLVRDPGFAAMAIGVLALGIGGNAAMFSLVDAVFLKPLPFPEPERIVQVLEAPTPSSRNGTTTLNFVDWKRHATSFEALSATRGLSATLTGDGEPTALGRTFVAGEDEPGAAPVVVLSHAAWQDRFGGAPGAVGRHIVLDGVSHEVVGVLPPAGFDREVGFWKPLVFAPEQRTRDYHWLGAVGRLKPATSLEQARAEMATISRALKTLQPAWKQEWGIGVDPIADTLVDGNLRRSVWVAFGAVALVLLLASANIANLLLAKGLERGREMAIRAAIGAGRTRLIAQVLTESLVLCLCGGLAGLLLAYLLIGAAVPLVAPSLPATATVALDLRVLGFASVVALGVSLLVGLLPALQLSGGRLADSASLSARATSSRDRVRRAIVVVEVAVSFVLICGAVLMFKSLARLQHVDAGVRIDNVMTMSADLSATAYPDSERAVQFIEAVVDRLTAVPGVDRAAVTTDLPLRGVRQGQALLVPGAADQIGARLKRVDAEYFAAFDIPVVAGRGFGRADRLGAPRVLVVNETLARRLAGALGTSDPMKVVGRTVRARTPRYENTGQTGTVEDYEIVGVIRNERVADLELAVPEVMYVSLAQVPRREIKLIVRAQGDPALIVPAVRAAVRELDPHLPISGVQSMRDVRQRSLTGKSQPTWLIGAFAAIAALLAALGLYGVVSNAVNQRRREIGIRMALGARSRDVLAQVLRNATIMIAGGLGLGLIGAFASTRLVETMLFQVSVLDPPAFTAAALAMAVVATLAALIPARRAARVDPVVALRTEG